MSTCITRSFSSCASARFIVCVTLLACKLCFISVDVTCCGAFGGGGGAKGTVESGGALDPNGELGRGGIGTRFDGDIERDDVGIGGAGLRGGKGGVLVKGLCEEC